MTDLLEFAKIAEVKSQSSIPFVIPSYDIKSVVNSSDELYMEFIADFGGGLESGTVFIVLPEHLRSNVSSEDSAVEAFHFFTKSWSENDRRRAIADGSYNPCDYRDSISDITIFKAVKDIHDLARIIRCWLNKYCYTDTQSIHKVVTLIHNGTKYQI